MADEKNSLEIDDWLDDLDDDKSGGGEEASDELDQSDIDALLGGGSTPPAAKAEAPAADDDGGELDQSDIDALLGGSPATAQGADDGDDFSELDQSDIDTLLGGTDLGTDTVPTADGGADTDQSDIDDLFAAVNDEASAADAAPAEIAGSEPSQDDVDQLFSDVGATESEEETLGAETVSFTEMLNEGAEDTATGDDTFGLPDDTGFDDDEFDFGDLPDIPDETTTGMAHGAASDDIFGDAGTTNELDDLLADADVATQEIPSPTGAKGLPFALPVDMNKKVMAMTAMCLVLLFAGGGYFFFFKGKKHEPAVPLLLQEQQLSSVPVGKPGAEEAQGNVPPLVVDAEVKMAQANQALSIELSGTDENNDPLQFEIVNPPKFGRLSGDVPSLTYLPNKDFPGQDSFSYRALDGKAVSPPATVAILGPQPMPLPAAKPKAAEPTRLVVAARDVRLKTLSTTPLEIDWQKIWAKANKTPFNAKVAVEIVDRDVRGKLTRINRSKHRYEPDKYFGGSELISYRFRYANVTSKVGQLLIKVELGDPPPEIRLQPLAKAYPVGESVVIDAGLTRDDSRESLIYSWEQVAGVPVQMEVLNDDASAISFVVPSSFYRQEIAQTVIRLTAIDQSGQRSSKEIVIPTVSRRQTALWRGADSGGLVVEPNCPGGECPGALLPWPYPD